jgi:hypothetical protein
MGWHLVPFLDKTGLTSALNSIQGGDYIYYNGTSGSPYVISSSTGIPLSVSNLNPASPAVIDFGCSNNIWDSSKVTSNYVKMSYTGTSNVNAMTLRNCSNLYIYGGYLTTGIGGPGAICQAPLSNVSWYDAYVQNVGSGGFAFRPQDSGNVASVITNFLLRAEVNRWGMNPTNDTHNDKGSGQHACILHGTTGELSNSTFAIWGHDPLRPGEVSNGQTWPEGSGGCVIEPGNDVGGPMNNLTLYAKGDNLLMQPTGAGGNPGSSGSGQSSGNVINLWGNVPLDGLNVGWAEGNNITGSVSHCQTGTWHPGSPAVTFIHGRGTNTNQFAGPNSAQRYMTGFGVVYSSDCL